MEILCNVRKGYYDFTGFHRLSILIFSFHPKKKSESHEFRNSLTFNVAGAGIEPATS